MKLKTSILAVLCAAGLTQALSPVETYGALSVKSAKLVDSKGSPVTLRGMSLFWHYDNGGKEFWTNSVVRYLQTDWNNAIIRAPIGVEDHTIAGGLTAKGYISSPTDAMNKITTIVEAAIQYGSYVIVDWHTHNAQTNAAKTFFETLAKKYGNTPNIIWEIFNEPLQGNTPVGHAKEIIPIIRKYSKNVILVGSSSWSSNPQEWGSDLDSYENIAYTIHFYSDHNFWDRIGQANAKNHAVFASEWGMSLSSGNGGFQNTSTGNIAQWLSNMESKGVSYCNWSLSNVTVNGEGKVPETSAALKLGVTTSPNAADPWTDASLTESGLSIRAWLRSKNPKWTVSDTTTKIVKNLTIAPSSTTALSFGKDSVFITAEFSKPVAWTLTETGRTSKAVLTTTGTSPDVEVRHIIGARSTATRWKEGGETVDVTLQPLNKTASYVISVTTGVTRIPLHEKQLSWKGSELVLGTDMIPAGKPVRVTLRSANGQAVWSQQATMGSEGRLTVGDRPRSKGMLVLDVVSDYAIFRSTLAPSF